MSGALPNVTDESLGGSYAEDPEQAGPIEDIRFPADTLHAAPAAKHGKAKEAPKGAEAIVAKADAAKAAEATSSAPVGSTITMVSREGKVVQVPREQATQAFLSGQAGFAKGQEIHVVGEDGKVGKVAPEHAQAVLSAGGRIASEEEYRKAALDAKYGGVGGTLASGGEGVARGLSLGVSDPLAVGAGRLLGGEKGAESVREHLRQEKEAHPLLSTGAELLGAAAPIVLSGGAAAPEEAAGLAARGGAAALGAADAGSVLGSIGEGVKTLGALPRGVSALGDISEHALSGVLGSTSQTVLGRAAQAAAKGAVRGITEGSLFGAGQAVSEGTLDNDLTAEKLFTTVGHGALMGGLLGGALTGAGKLAAEGASSVLGKVAGPLDEAAGEQAWKWLDPLKKYSDQATKRAGGTDAVGRTVFDEVLRPLVEEKGLAAAAISNDEKYELVQKALDAKGKAIGDLVEGHAHAAVPLEDMLRPIQERIEQFAGRVGGEDKVAALNKLKASVQRVLGAGEDTSAPIEDQLAGHVAGSPEHDAVLLKNGYVRRTPEELGAHLRANPDVLAKSANGSLPLEATHIAPEVAAERAPAMVPIADAIKQRRALQQLAFEESKSLDPNLRVQLLRDVSGEWNRIEEEALNKVSKEAGEGLAGTQLRDLNKTYQQLRIASDALETNTARYATNRNLSLTDYLVGAAHAPSMLLAGHPMAAAGALATSVAHKALRAHGNAYAALMLDRLSTMGGASKAAAEFDGVVDREIDRALAGTTNRLGRRMPRAFQTSSGDSQARFEKEEGRVRQVAAMSPGLIGAHLQDQHAQLATHMPGVAAQMQAQAKASNAYLASKLPPSQLGGQTGSLTPQLDKDRTSAPDKAKFLRAVDAVEGGPPEIMKRFAQGKMTPEDVEVLQKLYPHSYEEIRTKVASKCAERKTPLSYQQRIRFGTLFNLPTDPTLQPAFVMQIQHSYVTHPHAPEGDGGQKPAGRRAPASLSISRSLESTFEPRARGRS